MDLAHRLDAWLPVFVDQPFEHLRQQLKSIVKPEMEHAGRQIDWLKQAREKIDSAEAALQEKSPEGQQDDIGKVQAAYLEGGSDKAIAMSFDDQLKADLLFSEAFDLHERATAAASTNLPAARAFWQMASERFAQALAIKADYHQAASNWGTALSSDAAALAPSDLPAARALWQQAGERYAQALAIKADYYEAADNWGSACVAEYQAIKTVEPAAAGPLLDSAEKILRQAENIKPGSGAYNLACVAALRSDLQESLNWLRIGQVHGTLPSGEHIRRDKDFDDIRDTPEFKQWWEQVFGKGAALVQLTEDEAATV